MARVGNAAALGTAEGAAMGRAAHALHAEAPILADDWAVHLLDAETRARVRDPAFGRAHFRWDDFDVAPLFAMNVGSLRYAEDAVERCVRAGIDQYLILGAGFDTFALRRADLADRVRVFEVDHPDVQARKRARIAAADATPAALPTFVPVDFETTSLSQGLDASSFDPSRPAVVSWMNTIAYLSEEATRGSLREIAARTAPGSRLVLNYGCQVPFTEDQLAYVQELLRKVEAIGEPMRSRFAPEAFEALLAEAGFGVLEHATERDLFDRYFAGRRDGLAPRLPVRLVLAERAR